MTEPTDAGTAGRVGVAQRGQYVDVPVATRRAFADGDEAAFSEVYRRFSGPMFVVALRTTGRRDLAADVVQQAFLQAWRASATVSPNGPIAPWLFTITRRCAVDAWRKESRHASASLPQEETGEYGPAMETIWEEWQVRSALDELEADEREVIRLAYFEGLSQSEISDRTGTPLGTVKSRTGRAQRRLRSLLSHLTSEPTGGVAP